VIAVRRTVVPVAIITRVTVIAIPGVIPVTMIIIVAGSVPAVVGYDDASAQQSNDEQDREAFHAWLLFMS
jgi:hypothetical protein